MEFHQTSSHKGFQHRCDQSLNFLFFAKRRSRKSRLYSGSLLKAKIGHFKKHQQMINAHGNKHKKQSNRDAFNLENNINRWRTNHATKTILNRQQSTSNCPTSIPKSNKMSFRIALGVSLGPRSAPGRSSAKAESRVTESRFFRWR